MTAKGLPFKTKMAATLASKKAPGAVLPVTGGFVVRPGAVAPAVEAAPALAPAEAPPVAAPAQLSEGHFGRPDGQPFLSKIAAIRAAKQKPGFAPAEVPGGWAIAKPPRPSIAGEPIDDEWTAFTPESGTKGIPRADMPQIRAEHRGAMVQFLKGRGIEHEQDEVPAGDLKPTQAEFSPGKVAKAKGFTDSDRSILVSADGHVLDGHHQWMNKRDDDAPVKVIRLKAPIDELLAQVKEFPSVQAAAGATAPQSAAPEKTTEAAAKYSKEYSAEPEQAKPAPAAPAAQAKPERPKAPAPSKIDDFGETLHGARKHYAEAYRDRMADAKAASVKTEPLSKSWPEPDYGKMLEGGADPRAVAFVHAARDEVPTKPSQAYKLQQWVKQVELLRGFAFDLISGSITMDKVNQQLAEPQFSRIKEHVGGRADLYAAVGHERSMKGIRLMRGEYGLHEGRVYKPAKVIWAVERSSKASVFGNWPTELATGDTREDAIEAFKAKMADAQPIAKAAMQVKFDIYAKRGKPGVIIGKKVGKAYIDLKTMPDSVQARQFLADNQAELERLLAKYKEIPFERREVNTPRVGEDHRLGARMTPEAFSEAFGFRGVQFGNYVEDGRRQQDLDDAYDALMDMAAVIGVPPRALSLNGQLGLAFGARGKGGKRAAAAHYESGTVVINLTKGAGAGSLAHEWFHALDNYFARDSGDKAGFATRWPHYVGMRDEMQLAFKAIMDGIKATEVRKRSQVLDDRRSTPYWATDIELAARTFESYVIAKLQDQGAANDYLANVVGEGAFTAGEYPYPTASEQPAIRAAFDHFFNTIEH
ncbi:MAG: hypothetical protein EOP39_22150, partial [Rubrivivax sp.]